jgi:hypothetical protein
MSAAFAFADSDHAAARIPTIALLMICTSFLQTQRKGAAKGGGSGGPQPGHANGGPKRDLPHAS